MIKDQKVGGIHSSFAEAFSDACKHFPVGSFIIQKLGPDEEAYTTYIYSLSGCTTVD